MTALSFTFFASTYKKEKRYKKDSKDWKTKQLTR